MSKNIIKLELSMSDYGVIYNTLINERNQKLKNGMSTEVIDDCCIIHYNSCRDKDKMEQLISKLREESNIKNYIIDLRYNGGGNSSVIKPLIN